MAVRHRAGAARGVVAEAARVTDHAIVRYLERVKGVDLNRIRDELLTPEVELAIEAGCKTIRRRGYSMIIDPVSKAIITVVEGSYIPRYDGPTKYRKK